jgi:hypothetical protein
VIRLVEARREFAGPWWLAVAVLENQLHDIVEPALRELPSVELGPMRRAGTEGRIALHWGAGGAASPTMMAGELRIAEIDGNRTELRLNSYRHVAQKTLDRMTERLARRIETVVAEEIGTPAR